jgi:hypothetical protein
MEKLIPEDQAAEVLYTTRWTLARWRRQNKGPEWVRLGRKYWYKPSDLAAYLQANTSSSRPRPRRRRRN